VTPVSAAQALTYVRRILEAYLRLPDTPDRARAQDHELAAQLHRRGVDEEIVQAAFLVATARRCARPPGATPLGPIRSLHYFLPVIDELLQHPPAADFLSYLRETLATMIGHDPVDDDSKKDVFT
jgi:hypothetical protein